MERSPDLDDFDKVFGPQSTEQVPSYQRAQDPLPEPGPERPYSVVGKVSFYLGIAYLCLLILAYITGDGRSSIGAVIIMVILAIVCNLVGFIMGLIGLSQRDYHRGYAVAGTVINGLFLLVLVIIIFAIMDAF
jgi:ABC-type antimicrobial peptide transport system permease subunit